MIFPLKCNYSVKILYFISEVKQLEAEMSPTSLNACVLDACYYSRLNVGPRLTICDVTKNIHRSNPQNWIFNEHREISLSTDKYGDRLLVSNSAHPSLCTMKLKHPASSFFFRRTGALNTVHCRPTHNFELKQR